MTRPAASVDALIAGLIDGQGSLDTVSACVHRWQFGRSPAYRRLSAGRGVGDTVAGWRALPPISVDAFRFLDLRSFAPEATVATFRTSGTTGDGAGQHHFDDLALYRHACLAAFGPALLPESVPMRIVSLIPDAIGAPDSSLSQMVSWVIEAFGTPSSAVDPTGDCLEATDEPTLILGTALGLARELESRADLRLPSGSRIMETGGFKGRRRELSRTEMHELYHRAGIPSSHVVGEYGMTELSSQWYDGAVGSASPDVEHRVYLPPAWARTRVLNPTTLAEVDDGEIGLLLHVDPVNRGSAQAILTGDLGERRGPGFVYRGRATGAVLRGCSLRDERQT